MKKILNVLFNFISILALVVFMFSICALDSDTYFFYWSTAISFTWLVVAGFKSGVIGGECDEFT